MAVIVPGGLDKMSSEQSTTCIMFADTREEIQQHLQVTIIKGGSARRPCECDGPWSCGHFQTN